MERTDIPGGHLTQEAAVHALNEACAALLLCGDVEMRLSEALKSVQRVVSELATRKAQAREAIMAFAEVCPPCPELQTEIVGTTHHTDALIAEAETVVRLHARRTEP